jgi:hypothetical protein
MFSADRSPAGLALPSSHKGRECFFSRIKPALATAKMKKEEDAFYFYFYFILSRFLSLSLSELFRAI